MKFINEKNLITDLKIIDSTYTKFVKTRIISVFSAMIIWGLLFFIGYQFKVFPQYVFIYGTVVSILIGFKLPYLILKIRVKEKTKRVYYDFPLWLSSLEVLILSNNIPNTLKKSLHTCPKSMKKELEKFLEKIEKDPMNQQAYIQFLSSYQLSDVSELMLDLYQFNYLDKDLMIDEFTNLHQRLNAMDASQRKHQQEQNLFFIGAINSVPLFLLSIYILFIANMLSNILIGG